MKRCAASLFMIALAALTSTVMASGPLAAPDVTLALDSGSSLQLSELRGQVTLIDFWASWCIPCRASFPAIDALQTELRDRGFRVIAVNVDEERRSADQFLESRPHTVLVAFDPRGIAAQAFGLKGMPSTILIDRRGRIRFTHMGYTEKTLAQYRSEILQLLGEP
jgi:thiol-disulfide isomerase/thioredoxin